MLNARKFKQESWMLISKLTVSQMLVHTRKREGSTPSEVAEPP